MLCSLDFDSCSWSFGGSVIMNCWWFSLLVVGIFCVCGCIPHFPSVYLYIHKKNRQFGMFEGVGSVVTFGNTMIL